MASGTFHYMRRNPELVIGLCLLLVLLAFVAIGHAFVDLDKARPHSTRPLLAPSPSLPFGSDKQGRNLLAVMVVGTPQTLEIGVLAGLIGVGVGLAVPRPRDSCPGAFRAREGVHRRRPTRGHAHAGDHRQRSAAQPDAVYRRLAGRLGLGGGPGLGGSGGPWARLI